MSPFACFLCAP